MNICVLGPANSVHTQRWVGAMRDRGHHLSVLSPSPLPVPTPPPLRGVPVWPFPVGQPSMTRRQRLVTLLAGWGRVPSWVRLIQPDIVHIHSMPTPIASPLLARLPNLVISVWGGDVVHRDPGKARWYPLLLDHAAAVTATSHDLARVTQAYLARPRSIDVIAFGVETDRFQPGPPAPKRPFTIGALKGLKLITGQDVLLRAFAQLGPAPDGDLPRLILGGDGPQRAALQQLAHELGVSDRTSFPGAVDHAAVPAFLRSLDLFAMPSLSRSESFGVVALEAQACGVPVVASAIGGVPEVVVNGVTGLLVPPGEVAPLHAALDRCMYDQQLRRRFALAGPAWVHNTYEWSKNVDQMLAVYERVRRGA